ncbi:MAG: hypothetical protein WCH01_11540 [Methylococcaceae bacterium]
MFLKANEVLDPICQDDTELENHTFDAVVEEISGDSAEESTLPPTEDCREIK